MKRFLIKVLSFIAILVSEAWLLWPDKGWIFRWDASIALITSIVSYLGIESYEHYAKKPEPSPKDVELYEGLVALLPSNVIRFYKEHDFLGSFEKRYVDPLYNFVDTWENPEHEFIDKKLEKARRRLLNDAQPLASTIAKKTTPNHAGLISVKSDHLPPGPTPDWVKRDAEEINKLTPAFVESHEKFVRLGRKRLYEKNA